MEPYTKERERRLSSKKPYFKDRRSAVISIAVVVFLLTLAILAIDQNNVRRLGGYLQQAQQLRRAVDDHVEKRFSTLENLLVLVDHSLLRNELSSIIDEFYRIDDVVSISTLYVRMDRLLSDLQRELFAKPTYNVYAPYFEYMYQVEQKLADSVALYNNQAEFYNRQIEGFPALIVAKRLSLERLPLFTMAQALSSRP